MIIAQGQRQRSAALGSPGPEIKFSAARLNLESILSALLKTNCHFDVHSFKVPLLRLLAIYRSSLRVQSQSIRVNSCSSVVNAPSLFVRSVTFC
jgi:hypothetical protein